MTPEQHTIIICLHCGRHIEIDVPDRHTKEFSEAIIKTARDWYEKNK